MTVIVTFLILASWVTQQQKGTILVVVLVVIVVVLPKEGKASDAIVTVEGIFVENFTIVIELF